MDFVWAADWHAQTANHFRGFWFLVLIEYPLSMVTAFKLNFYFLCSLQKINNKINFSRLKIQFTKLRIHERVGPMDGGMGWAKKLPTSDPGWPKVEMIKDTSLPLFFIATFLSLLSVCAVSNPMWSLKKTLLCYMQSKCWQSIFQLHTTLIGVIIFRV